MGTVLALHRNMVRSSPVRFDLLIARAACLPAVFQELEKLTTFASSQRSSVVREFTTATRIATVALM